MSRYTIPDEHRAQLQPWAQRWIDNAMSTAPISDEERATSEDAARRLYEAAELKAPRVVWARGPISGAVAATVATGIWWLRQHPEKHAELFGRTLYERDLMAAIDPACEFVVRHGVARLLGEPRSAAAATYSATAADAVRNATDSAVHAATAAATSDATEAATRAASGISTPRRRTHRLVQAPVHSGWLGAARGLSLS